jgi:hypothetical protein
MRLQQYPTQIDCVWIGVDKIGQLAAFITAGCGPIPTKLLIECPIPIIDIEECLYKLNSISEVKLHVKKVRPDSFLELARRGLFVFDWSDVHRIKKHALLAYELIASPNQPLHCSSLPSELAALAKIVEFENMNLSDYAVLSIGSMFGSTSPE